MSTKDPLYSTKKDLQQTDDAIIGTLNYLENNLGLNAYQYEKVVVLMRLSYKRGLLAETIEQVLFKRKMEEYENGE